MDTVYKSDQVYVLSKRLGLPNKSVKAILDEYCNILKDKINRGISVKVLNLCYLEVNNSNKDYKETLAYTCSDIGIKLSLGKDIVLGVLLTLDELIRDDLKKYFTYVLLGLVKLQIDEYKPGVFKLRLNKSNTLPYDVRVRAVTSFKKGVE